MQDHPTELFIRNEAAGLVGISPARLTQPRETSRIAPVVDRPG
jgi:hypothetical protein